MFKKIIAGLGALSLISTPTQAEEPSNPPPTATAPINNANAMLVEAIDFSQPIIEQLEAHGVRVINLSNFLTHLRSYENPEQMALDFEAETGIHIEDRALILQIQTLALQVAGNNGAGARFLPAELIGTDQDVCIFGAVDTIDVDIKSLSSRQITEFALAHELGHLLNYVDNPDFQQDVTSTYAELYRRIENADSSSFDSNAFMDWFYHLLYQDEGRSDAFAAIYTTVMDGNSEIAESFATMRESNERVDITHRTANIIDAAIHAVEGRGRETFVDENGFPNVESIWQLAEHIAERNSLSSEEFNGLRNEIEPSLP